MVVGHEQVELNQDDLLYFVEYVLLDEAQRDPSGKRQMEPMKGFWMSRSGDLRSMRKSDRRVRYCVAIEALRAVGGMSVDKSAVEVANTLGMTSAAEVDVIRVAYYECRYGRYQVSSFYQNFLLWRDWLLQSDEETRQREVEDFGRKFGDRRKQRLALLLDSVRLDPVQAVRHREWRLESGHELRTRIETNYWDPESEWEWELVANDLTVLGRLHAKVGDFSEARVLLERALGLWKAHGGVIPDEQAYSITMLQYEIAQCAGDLKASEPKPEPI